MKFCNNCQDPAHDLDFEGLCSLCAAIKRDAGIRLKELAWVRRIAMTTHWEYDTKLIAAIDERAAKIKGGK